MKLFTRVSCRMRNLRALLTVNTPSRAETTSRSAFSWTPATVLSNMSPWLDTLFLLVGRGFPSWERARNTVLLAMA